MEDRKSLGIKSGDTVRVHQKIEDKGKTRIQIFEGLVLARKHGSEPGATFTVRKVVDGIGVEKIFPLYSPRIDKIEIIRRSTVRRAKLYYIREKVAREIKRQMRRMRLMNVSSESEIEVERGKKEEAEAATKAAEEAQIAEEAKVKEQAEIAAKAAEEATATEVAEVPVESVAEVVAEVAKEEEVK
ncbi:MAG: 50S ribosomal protein L19 [Candidatus Pacebacteria bacterium]|nr:50S ribosomal protein L19 [Candidatus Paceibacterota bacterium]MCF7857613.1 50S ribosomal protein L19 [Candidatus Paceibacterota bacterium]